MPTVKSGWVKKTIFINNRQTDRELRCNNGYVIVLFVAHIPAIILGTILNNPFIHVSIRICTMGFTLKIEYKPVIFTLVYQLRNLCCSTHRKTYKIYTSTPPLFLLCRLHTPSIAYSCPPTLFSPCCPPYYCICIPRQKGRNSVIPCKRLIYGLLPRYLFHAFHPSHYNPKEYSALFSHIFMNTARSLSSASEHGSMLSAGLFLLDL